MKGGRPPRRSEISYADIGVKYIDDRGPVLRKMCHGDPARSFWYRGRPLPICARCTAIYPSIPIGAGLGLLFGLVLHPPLIVVTISFALLVFPGALDGTTQYWFKRRSNNILRAYTGVLYGAGIGLGIVYIPLGLLGIF